MLGANLFGLLFCETIIGKIGHRCGFAGVALHFESYIVHQKGRSKKTPPQKTQEIPGFFACLGVKKVKGFSVDTKPPFSQSCRTRTCVNTGLREIRATDQKICSQILLEPLPRRQQNMESSRRLSEIFSRNEKRWTGLVPEDDEDEK